MITNEHIEQFIEQAHRYGDAKLMLCSSGNLSWRIGEEALISGTGSWVPTLGKEKVSICNIASGTPTNGVKSSYGKYFPWVFSATPDGKCGTSLPVRVCHGYLLHEKQAD